MVRLDRSYLSNTSEKLSVTSWTQIRWWAHLPTLIDPLSPVLVVLLQISQVNREGLCNIAFLADSTVHTCTRCRRVHTSSLSLDNLTEGFGEVDTSDNAFYSFYFLLSPSMHTATEERWNIMWNALIRRIFTLMFWHDWWEERSAHRESSEYRHCPLWPVRANNAVWHTVLRQT